MSEIRVKELGEIRHKYIALHNNLIFTLRQIGFEENPADEFLMYLNKMILDCEEPDE